MSTWHFLGQSRTYFTFFRSRQANSDYHEDLMAIVEVIEEYGGAGSLSYFPNMIKKELVAKSIDMDKATGDEMKKQRKQCARNFLPPSC